MSWDEELFDRIADQYDRVFAAEVLHTEAQVDFVVRALGLRPGQHVVDLCCGPGRHALALARRGVRVTAVDRSAPLLAEARRRANAAGVQVRWVEADIRALPPLGPFAGAVCLFSAWGQQSEPGQDVRTLAAIAERLLPGARLILDIPNAAWLEAHPSGATLAVAGGTAIREVRSYDRGTRLLRTTWRVHQARRPPWSAQVTYRVYPLQEMEWLLARAGLVLEAAFGGFDGAPLSADHPRCVVLARRPILPVLGAGGAPLALPGR